MQAIVLREFGGPGVLSLEEVPMPRPGAEEVLVRVRAVSVNPTLDILAREGRYPRPIALPHVPGVDPAGDVVAVGEGVRGAEPGDRVAVYAGTYCGKCVYCVAGEDADCSHRGLIGVDRWGGYAEYVAVPARNAFPIPDGMSYEDATFVTRHCPTAIGQLEAAEVRAGDVVLVMGAAGSLGVCAVQVAKLMGATVIAGAGDDGRVDIAREFGADFGVNYREDDLQARAMEITGGKGADVVVENIGDPILWRAAFGSLAFRGRLVTAGAHGGREVTIDVRALYLGRYKIIGAVGGSRRNVEQAIKMAANRGIRSHIGRRFPLRSAAEAQQAVADRAVTGKVILEP